MSSWQAAVVPAEHHPGIAALVPSATDGVVLLHQAPGEMYRA